LYRADPHPSEVAGSPLYVRARREVILAAGAFNTPQLLMLSGIGPRDELERHGIPVVVDRPGVGRNLQDRYEISVVSRMNGELALVRDCTFAAPAEGEAADPCYVEWRRRGSGVYGTNGIACAVVRRSREDLPAPDLFIFGAPGLFRGYYHGYAGALTQAKNCFTWAVLKGQTRNTSGRVTLASPDPRDPPRVDFNYFDPADPSSRDDLDAVVAGVAFARRIFERSDVAADAELLPGPGVQGRDAIARYVEDQAWGHHASCTCPMGRADDPRAVLDADFRVRGVTGLRVVDASVFPRIPGFFIVSAIYMIAEKASDRILASADADVAPPRR
ncbi:MAG: GMC family oxidoreductase N-terminal domain-containing protein, partial [Myxococcales bacterium]|nr:GMC family oxidoreductase N-terminal domain-containing protein [Myxococcales bacterium]